MTIIELIRREHDEVADLFDHLVVLARDHRRVEEATRVAARLAAVVRIHSRTEERALYETLRTRDPALRAAAFAGPHATASACSACPRERSGSWSAAVLRSAPIPSWREPRGS